MKQCLLMTIEKKYCTDLYRCMKSKIKLCEDQAHPLVNINEWVEGQSI